MGTSSESGHGELEVRKAGRPPAELSPDASDEGRRLAQLLRQLVFDPLREQGYGHREISKALGKGYSAAVLSRLSRADKVPTIAELAPFVAFAEKTTGKVLSLPQRQELEAAHLKALVAVGSHLPDLFLTQQACLAYQIECERAQSSERSARKELLQAHRLLHEARRTEAMTKAALARSERARERGTARLTETREVLLNLELSLAVQKAALSDEILTLRRAVSVAAKETRRAEQQAATANRKMAEVQEKLLEELASREALAEELAVVTATLQQVRGERDAVKETAELRSSEASVLADADATLRRAERELSEQIRVGPGGAGDAPGAEPEADAEAREQFLQAALFAPESEVADLVADLADQNDGDAVGFVLSTAAARSGEEVASLIQELGEAGYWPHRDQLFRFVADQPAASVCELLRVLERNEALTEMGLLFDAAVLADVEGLLRYLLQQDLRVYAARLLDAAVRRRSTGDLAGLVRTLQEEGRHQEADGLVRDAASHRSPRDVLGLLQHVQAHADADRLIRVTLEAAGQRTPKAVTALWRALDDAGLDSLAAQLLASTVAQPVGVVAELANELAAQDSKALERLLRDFVDQRSDALWQLLTHLAVRSPRAMGVLLEQVGEVAPSDLLIFLALQADKYLPQLPESSGRRREDPADVLLARTARRPGAQVLDLILAFQRAARPKLADKLIQCAVGRPAALAVEVISGLLDTGFSSDRLAVLVAGGLSSLDDAVTLACALHEQARCNLARHLLQMAGGRAAFSTSEVISVLSVRRPGWVAQSLLSGSAGRHEDLVAELVGELYQAELHAYVQLLLSAVPVSAHSLVPLADALWANELQQDASWLLSSLVSVASAGELAFAFSLDAPHLGNELLVQVLYEVPGGRVGPLVQALSRRGLALWVVALLREAARAPASWIAVCSASFRGKVGRPRQAAWLDSQAGSKDSARWPPAETEREAADALTQLYAAGETVAAEAVLLATIRSEGRFAWHDVLTELPHEVKKHAVRVVLEYVPDLALTATAEQSLGILAVLAEEPELRARYLRPPSGDLAQLFAALVSRQDSHPASVADLKREILDLSVTLPDAREVIAVARQALGSGDSASASHLIWNALRTRPLEGLAPLVRFAVAHHLSEGRTEIQHVLAEIHPDTPRQLEACLSEAFRPEFDLDIVRSLPGTGTPPPAPRKPRTSTSGLVVKQAIHDAIIRHARDEYPNIACGVVTGPLGAARPTRHIPMVNAAASPTFWEWRPEDALKIYREMDDRDEEPVIIYHSNPATEAYPSRLDIQNANEPGAYYVVVSLADPATPQFRAFRIVEYVVTEADVTIIAR